MCVSVLLCLEDNIFLVSPPPLSSSYNLSLSSSAKTPEPWGKGLYKGIPFRTQCSTLRAIAQCTLPVLLSIHCKKKLLWWGLHSVIIYKYSNMPLGVIWLLCSFSRIIVLAFPLGPTTYVVSGFSDASSTWHRCYFLEYLNPINTWWLILQCLCSYCTSMACRQITKFVADSLSPPVVNKVLSSSMNTSLKVKLLVGHQLDTPCSTT